MPSLKSVALGLLISASSGLFPFFASSAHAGPSFLFGSNAREAFGAPNNFRSFTYFEARNWVDQERFYEIPPSFGHERPTALRILIKNDFLKTPYAQSYVEALSLEKANLMHLYGLKNSEYNRLAAIAFGILGRETRFGLSPKYVVKENAQFMVTLLKRWKNGSGEVGDNSRGLTQIKVIPEKVKSFYCVHNARDLRNPRIAAVATLGFLAESLEYTRYRARVRQLTYINDENVYDYVLYVYFGSMSQLALPRFNAAGQQINEIATPSRNIYLQTVKRYIRNLALFENENRILLPPRNNACPAQ